jgi:hypothetical protein
MQPAAAQTVLGNFNDARYTDFGVTSRFFKKGEQFFINTEGADGRCAGDCSDHSTRFNV